MISVVWLLILDGLVSGFRKLISWEFHTQMVKKDILKYKYSVSCYSVMSKRTKINPFSWLKTHSMKMNKFRTV